MQNNFNSIIKLKNPIYLLPGDVKLPYDITKTNIDLLLENLANNKIIVNPALSTKEIGYLIRITQKGQEYNKETMKLLSNKPQMGQIFSIYLKNPLGEDFIQLSNYRIQENRNANYWRQPNPKQEETGLIAELSFKGDKEAQEKMTLQVRDALIQTYNPQKTREEIEKNLKTHKGSLDHLLRHIKK